MEQAIDLTESVKYFSELIYKGIEQNMWTVEDLQRTLLNKCPVDKLLICLKTLKASGKIEKHLLMGSEFYTLTLKQK